MFNRRQFLQTSSTATLGMAFLSPQWVSASKSQFNLAATTRDGLTPNFLAEDVLRLIQIDQFQPSFREALSINMRHFQLGKVWQIPAEELLKVAKDSKENWNNEMNQDRAKTQYALVCGKIAHDTFTQMLPKEDGSTLSDATIYRDTYVIKSLQNADPHRQKVPFDRPIEGVSPEEVASLFHVIQQRNLIRMHTIRPEFSDISTWLDNMLAFYETMKADNDRYAMAYCWADAAKVKKYVTDQQFYEPTDTPIQAARQFQMTLMTGKTNQLMNRKAVVSIYGKALNEALSKLRVCEEYVLGKKDEKALQMVL